MVECGAKEISEDKLIDALEFGFNAIQPLIKTQIQMAIEMGNPNTNTPLLFRMRLSLKQYRTRFPISSRDFYPTV